jgi:hypothetical protein
MRTLLSHLTVVVSLLTSLFSASADTIVFRYESSGTGTLNGVSFSERAFTIVAAADTANRQSVSSGIFSIDHTLVTIEIAGLGTFDILSPTRTFVNQDLALAGFARAGLELWDLLHVQTNDLFASWDMLSSVGPLEGEGRLLQWASRPVNTSAGLLVFDSQATMVRFTATIDDVDSDGDGVLDVLDQCPNTPANTVVDAHGCSIEQLVPCAGPLSGGRWNNRGQYVFFISQKAAEFEAQGLITGFQKGAIISAAARSDCGK